MRDELKSLFVIVGVGDATGVIAQGAMPDDFDEFLPKAQEVMETIKWQE